jgi:subtilisin family serine protease
MKFKKLLILLLGIAPLLPYSASALLMRDDGPEPVIVQIKESVRLSDQLDDRLDELASICTEDELQIVQRWAGSKFLLMLTFPSNFNEGKALNAISHLEALPGVEKVVPVSAFNLHFRSGDLKRGYDPTETVPDVARRGLDADRIGTAGPSAPDKNALAARPHVPNRLIVRWKEENIWNAQATGFNGVIEDFNHSAGCSVVRELRYSPSKLTQVLEFGDPDQLSEKLQTYIESGLVVYAQPDFLYEINTVPNDPWYASFPGPQWSLPHISAPLAWGLTSGSSSVIIAVGDTGANVAHPDFSPNMVNSSLHHNFITGGNNVDDDNGHGSGTASIIGAQGNNGYAMAGVALDTSLMILKICDQDGITTSSLVADAIVYAADHGATAINLSIGGLSTHCYWDAKNHRYVCDTEPPDGTEMEAMRYARDHNMVVVCAAGNMGGVYWPDDGSWADNNDFDKNQIMPASLSMDNNISVMATNQSDVVASYSSYGKYRVDLSAPSGGGYAGGPSIPVLRQTFHVPAIEADRGFLSGTSAAAPHVAGAIALIKSLYPWETYLGLRDRVLMGTDGVAALQDKCRTNGRLNLYRALKPRTMLKNLSTRARVENGDKVMIAGFIIGGSASGGSINVVMRGLGPSVGVNPPLGNPFIELHYPDNHVETNDDWASDFRHNEVVAVGLQPPNSSEAAMIRTLPPGAYTVILRDAGTAYGVGLVELYALGSSEQSRLQNISTRCLVGTGDNVAIAGTIIGDNQVNSLVPPPNRRVLIFGKGPSIPLNVLDIPGPSPLLQNPQIQINGGASNDNWQTFDDDSGDQYALEEELDEAGRAPTSIAESALWPTFGPSAQTVILSGVNQATGIGLIEFYEY